MSDRKFGVCILLRTSHYRGDHSVDVQIAHAARPSETVQELAERLLGHDDSGVDSIVIRRVFVGEVKDE